MLRPFSGLLEPGRGEPALAGAAGVEVEGVLCAIDGAVHNHAELALELGIEDRGPEETIARGYRRWGGALAPRLRGEFALLVWDRAGGRGLLAPDQLGVHAVFFLRQGRRLWFATEVRDLLALLPSRPAPDPRAIGCWLTARAAPAGGTLYAGVESLGPGRMLELDRDGARLRRYWRPRYREPLDLPLEELVGRVGAGLRTAVARRTTPGAAVGVLMSGGLDSTSVAALAQRASPAGARAFSATFPDYPRIDETSWIEALESGLELPSARLAARPQGILASGIEHLGEWELPLHGWSEAWTQPLLRLAAETGVSAMLSGEGGDELFGSRLFLLADLIRGGRALAALRFARHLPEAGGHASRRVLRRVLWEFGLAGVPSAGVEALWRRLGPGRAPTPWWATPRMRALLHEGPEPPSWRAGQGPRWWAALTHALTEGVHGFDLFGHLRRRTAQAGLEARHPLFDLDLLELMLAVPPALCSKGRLTRPLLRAAMAGVSPDVVRLRPGKSVFDELVTDALTGPELPALRELLGGASELRAYVRPEALAELVAKPPPHQRGDAGAWVDDVLRLVAIELWLRSQEDPELPRRLLEDPLVPAPEYRIEVHAKAG